MAQMHGLSSQRGPPRKASAWPGGLAWGVWMRWAVMISGRSLNIRVAGAVLPPFISDVITWHEARLSKMTHMRITARELLEGGWLHAFLQRHKNNSVTDVTCSRTSSLAMIPSSLSDQSPPRWLQRRQITPSRLRRHTQAVMTATTRGKG